MSGSMDRRNSHGSSTEVEDSLMGHEKPWEQPIKRENRFCRTIRSCRWVVDTVLLLVILGLVVRGQKGEGEGARRRPEIGGDVSGYAPDFVQQIVRFEPDPSYAPENTSEFFTDEVRQKWLDLVPKGLGYIEIGGAWKYDNLPTPLPEYAPNDVFTTSVTHQLHCLYTIVEAYSAARSAPEKLTEQTPWHLSHCFDYLRQSIMCCGDVALEGKETTFPDGFHEGSDGWDAKHVCRDYNQVFRFLTRRRADNRSWI